MPGGELIRVFDGKENESRMIASSLPVLNSSNFIPMKPLAFISARGSSGGIGFRL
jgi:hypothetical protein